MARAATPVLVTGATGRLGSHLVKVLMSQNAKVRALCLPEDPRARVLGECGVEVVTGSLLDQAAVRQAVEGVSTVFHLGASMTTRGANARSVVESIAIGTFHVVSEMSAAQNESSRLVMTSSTSVYGTAGGNGGFVTEATPVSPATPYGAAKVAAEALVAQAVARGQMRAVIVRPCDTADTTEILDPDSVFGRRWFVDGAVRWFGQTTPGFVDRVDESVYEQLLSHVGHGRLFFVTDSDGVEPMVQVNAARALAERLVDLAYRGGAEGLRMTNLVPRKWLRSSEIVTKVALQAGVDSHDVVNVGLARTWPPQRLFGSIHGASTASLSDVFSTCERSDLLAEEEEGPDRERG